MTAIKLNSIEGLMVEKKEQNPLKMIWENNQTVGANKLIDEQGNREITMDREKLAEIIFHTDYPRHQWNTTIVRDNYLRYADATIANMKDIIKAV